jgi:diacylglycerol kinase
MFLKDAIANLILKFNHAISGVIAGLAHDRSLRVHYLISVLVIIAFAYLNITMFEWLVVLLGIALVISLEYINSSIELLCDHVHAEFHETIKKIKDFGAAAVLIASIIVGVIGIMIALQYI